MKIEKGSQAIGNWFGAHMDSFLPFKTSTWAQTQNTKSLYDGGHRQGGDTLVERIVTNSQ